MKMKNCCTWTYKSLQGLAFPVQYRVTEVGPPVRYRSQNCEDWCVLQVLYCRYSPSLPNTKWKIQYFFTSQYFHPDPSSIVKAMSQALVRVATGEPSGTDEAASSDKTEL